ncbi:MAG: hypothetical protein HUK40_01245 [Desulfobacter sp.]|nr:hypothetical protein [Desulfobacter sp.]WDP85546.1 MAG: hypothetical protein HUN05_10735 [Desulfobacter sp.]
MEIESSKIQAYLYQLNQMTQSDPSANVSMYAVGDALGLEKEAAAKTAETLFMGGQAELKTLSGGIGITIMGIKALGITPKADPDAPRLSLSHEIGLTSKDRQTTDLLLDRIKSGLGKKETQYDLLDQVIMDIKTIEVHLLSVHPKTAVVRELFRSIFQALPAQAFPEISGQLDGLVNT